MTVHMTITDIEEYSLRSNTVLDCTMYNQITVGNVTLPKAVLSTVKIFAVWVQIAIATTPTMPLHIAVALLEIQINGFQNDT